MNILLVDGNALYKTGFYGAKTEFNRDGVHIGGLYQFITVVRKLLNENLYHKVFVFWDGKFSGKLRYEIYSPYKSGRGKDYINGTEPKDESELTQKFIVQEYLEELFIRQLEHNFIESDDFIAYFCLTRKENEKITICSNDRDMCQLISDDVTVYFCDLKVYVDKNNYSSYFKHHSDNSVLIKTMVGDNSDTIKGVKGVKEKTLLTHFPELKERRVELNEIIDKAKVLQEQRINNKLKPLKAFTNIVEGITDGVQGDKLYEINARLVDLGSPMMTQDGIEMLEQLIDSPLDPEHRSIKNAYIKMKRDGLDILIGEYRYTDYLIPFKKLMERELKNYNLTN